MQIKKTKKIFATYLEVRKNILHLQSLTLPVRKRTLGHKKARPVRLAVRTSDFHSGNRGSIPLRAIFLMPKSKWMKASLLRHHICRCGGIGRRTWLKIMRSNPCRFESDHRYFIILETLFKQRFFFIYRSWTLHKKEWFSWFWVMWVIPFLMLDFIALHIRRHRPLKSSHRE